MAQLTIDDVLGYLVEGQRLEPGMVIRRLDIIDGNWYEGNVGKVVSTHPETHEQRTSFALIVPGYAPSPLRPGDDIEIVSRAELYNREMDERNRISYENREKPWLPLHEGE